MNAFDLMNKLSVIYDARQQWKVDHKRVYGKLLDTHSM